MTDESDLDDAAVEDTGCRAATWTFGFFGAADCFGAATSMLGSVIAPLEAAFVLAAFVPAASCASATLLKVRNSSAVLESKAALDVRIMI